VDLNNHPFLNDGIHIADTSVIRCQELPVGQQVLLRDFDDQKEISSYLEQFDLTNEERSRLADIKRILI